MSQRRLGAAVVGTLAIALVAGCSASKPTATDQNSTAPIEMWIRQAPDSDSAKTAQRLADAFTKSSGIKVKVVALFDDFETKLQQQAAQKALPDIVINDTAQLGTMQSQGWLREVDKKKFATAGQLSDRAWKAAQASDGRYYAAPFSAQSFALIVRKDWRAKVGLPAPSSWDDLAKLGAAFTDGDPDGDGKKDTSGFVIPATTKRGYASWYTSSLLWANGGDFLAPGGAGKWKPAVNSEKSVQAVTWLRDQFCVAKSVNPGAVNNDTTVTHEAFEKGQGGIYLVGPYVLARFVKNMGTDKIEVIPVPNGPAGGPGTLGEGENVYMMAGSKNQSGQQKFAEFVTSVEGQQIGMNKDDPGAIVRLPVNTTVDLGAVRQDPRWKVFQEAYKAAVYTPPVPNWAPFRQTTADAMNAVYANCGTSVKTAMDDLAGKLSDELKKQNALAS
ncbi:sugar ABC transporter substrate-binding protein [Longispora fulva]|uniref:Multiple sugar transport system substrate-binding protein n=1 Tax=Longispora fulva TaxID=619741 RepID=A0A8J7KK46_9ACTN|nr:sugar ABC transporter substrate-binding protein [Longispora fulva]MBG6137644.1 multiple sugar transport system substrate-binding protein [Longispora fulva]GIG62197.1 sugar ABC transporter substrate-binding protein [Longispora fulva]